MPKAKPLIVDLTGENLTEEYHRQVVVVPPIRSCLTWEGFYFGEYHEPFLDTPEHSHPHHEIVTLHFKEPTPTEVILDGHVQNESLVSGSVIVFPTHVPHQVMSRAGGNFSILTLDLAQIASVAYEDVKTATLKLVPQVALFDPVIHNIEQLLRLELQGNEFGNHLYVDSLITALSIHLLRQYAAEEPKRRENFVGSSYHQLRDVIDYIHEHLGENLSLDALAQTVGMSRYHFIRCFKQAMGVSPYQYLIEQRIERAKQLLRESVLSIAEVALACGFANQSHLTNHFKQRVGVTPRTFHQATQQ